MSRLSNEKLNMLVDLHQEKYLESALDYNVSLAVNELKKYRDLNEQGLLLKEEDVLKFYYCESLDKYLVGKRLDTMYYADITDMGDLHFFMSRYLSWGENTYPSEPKEIPFTEWLKGYLKQRELKEGAE